MLALTAWFVVASFPLQGSPQVAIQQGAVADAPGVTVETGGRILHPTPVQYPAELVTKGVFGLVTIEATLDAQGIVSDAHVLSGPEELRRSALESVLQWHYVKDASTPPRVQVTIDFRLPAKPALATVTPPPLPPELQGAVGSADVSGLPEPLRSVMRSRLAPFEGQLFSVELRDKIIEAVHEVDPHARAMAMFKRAAEKGPWLVWFRVTLGADVSVPPPPPTSPDPPAPGVQRVVVGGAVQASKIIEMQRPVYPPLAQQARIQGLARFTAIIGVDGKVQSITVVSGHPLLIPAAQEAVRQYVYQPTLLNGQPVEVVTQIDVIFSLQ
jgi:TonB family protein